MSQLLVFKAGALASAAVAAALIALWLAQSPDSPLRRAWARYCGFLGQKLYRCFIFMPAARIAYGQLAALAFVAIGATITPQWATTWAAVALLVLIGPTAWLAREVRQRVQKIDDQVDGFLVAAANALKSRPAIGDAIASVAPMMPNPLRQELEVVVKQMHVGSSVDQALLHMGGRVGSRQLDTGLSAILIGRQVGGDLPVVMERTAAAMREMARLGGVVRTKTASGKAQIWVLALFPFVLVLAFGAVSPGYFDPLSTSVMGYLVTAVAIVLWGMSLVSARKILAVDL